MNPSNLPKMSFPYDEMKLTTLFAHPAYRNEEIVVDCETVRKVLGEPFRFQGHELRRPFIYNSVVTSIDGKIAFLDAPEGPLIASKNDYDPMGALTDWWLLNLLRSSADAILFGANTLRSEPTATGHIYDQSLEDARIARGLSPVPINVIPTLDGTDIPFDHKEFTCGEIPVVFYTVLNALDRLKEHFPDIVVLGPYGSPDDVTFDEFVVDPSKKYAMICGHGHLPNPHIAMRMLHKMGIKRLLVESPMMTHLLLEERLMDELFINISCLYVGGDALSIGKRGNSFTSKRHPHTELIHLSMHSPHFMYTRHRLME